MTPAKSLAHLLGIQLQPAKRLLRERKLPTALYDWEPLRPPSGLAEMLKPIWHDVVSKAPAGVLCSSDAIFVEMTCLLLYQLSYESLRSSEVKQLGRHLRMCCMPFGERCRLIEQYMPKSWRRDFRIVTAGLWFPFRNTQQMQ